MTIATHTHTPTHSNFLFFSSSSSLFCCSMLMMKWFMNTILHHHSYWSCIDVVRRIVFSHSVRWKPIINIQGVMPWLLSFGNVYQIRLFCKQTRRTHCSIGIVILCWWKPNAPRTGFFDKACARERKKKKLPIDFLASFKCSEKL